MVEESVGEEVPVVWLTGNTPHGNQVCGVNSISQEFKSHSWSKWRLTISCWSSSRGQSDESFVSSVEDSTVLVGFGNKLDLTNGSNRVYILSSVSYNYPGGIASPLPEKVGSIDSTKMPGSSRALGNEPEDLSAMI